MRSHQKNYGTKKVEIQWEKKEVTTYKQNKSENIILNVFKLWNSTARPISNHKHPSNVSSNKTDKNLPWLPLILRVLIILKVQLILET